MTTCSLHTKIERCVFGVPSSLATSTSKDACPICLEPLSLPSTQRQCCGNYARALPCGHEVHVSCQLACVNYHQCSVCRNFHAEKKEIDFKVQQVKKRDDLLQPYPISFAIAYSTKGDAAFDVPWVIDFLRSSGVEKKERSTLRSSLAAIY